MCQGHFPGFNYYFNFKGYVFYICFYALKVVTANDKCKGGGNGAGQSVAPNPQSSLYTVVCLRRRRN